MEDGTATLNYAALPIEIRVGVHDGPFHADEVLSLALLRHWLAPRKVSWIRTRDPQKLSSVGLRIDVGEGLLDHHGARMVKGQPIAACTRVWQLLRGNNNDTTSLRRWEEAGHAAIDQLVSEVAKSDCGMPTDVDHCWVVDVVRPLSRQASLNQGLAEENFAKAVEIVTFVLDTEVSNARAAVEATDAAIRQIEVSDHASRVVVFDESARAADLKVLLYNRVEPAWFYISPEGAEWRVLCAADPDQQFSYFSSWHLIPQEFCGLRGEELSVASGVAGGIFCHKAGFVAGFRTLQGALDFASICVSKIQAEA